MRSPGRGEGGASYTVYELVYIQQRRPDVADVGVDVAEIVEIVMQFTFAETVHRYVNPRLMWNIFLLYTLRLLLCKII